jgi:hypothetical protein
MGVGSMASEPAALVSVCVAYMLSRLRVGMFHRDQEEEDNPSNWVPRAVTDGERQANLDKIYNCTDVESVSMLRMRKAPFFNLVKLFRERSLLEDTMHYCMEEQVRNHNSKETQTKQLSWNCKEPWATVCVCFRLSETIRCA